MILWVMVNVLLLEVFNNSTFLVISVVNISSSLLGIVLDIIHIHLNMYIPNPTSAVLCTQPPCPSVCKFRLWLKVPTGCHTECQCLQLLPRNLSPAHWICIYQALLLPGKNIIWLDELDVIVNELENISGKKHIFLLFKTVKLIL